MKIVVPMAGRGARLANRGFARPKPLIDIAGRPMVGWALESIRDIPHDGLVFVALAEYESDFGLTRVLTELLGHEPSVVLLPGVTEGQLCTVLAARANLCPDEDLLIISSDTLVVSRLGHDIRNRPADCQGLISVKDMPGDRWSFARTDGGTRVVEVTEKIRISPHASTGMYYFSRAAEFLECADEMIAGNERTLGEFYVMPLYCKYLERGWRVDISIATEMWDMGNAEALEAFSKRQLQP